MPLKTPCGSQQALELSVKPALHSLLDRSLVNDYSDKEETSFQILDIQDMQSSSMYTYDFMLCLLFDLGPLT